MGTAAKKRKVLARHGARRRWVRVFLERGHTRITVQWRVAPALAAQQSFGAAPAQRAEALAFAEGVAARLRAGTPTTTTAPLTLATMWEKYRDAEFPHLRPRTRELYEENYRRWCVYFGWEFVAERTTPEMADAFRKALTAGGLALKTIRNSVDDVKRVFLWAETRELLQRNRLRLYRFKVAKEDRPVSPAEYRADEFERILAQLDPANARQWRAWVALAICGTQGARQNAVLHLTPDDVTETTISWRAEWDKTGKAWTQPARARTLEAYRVAMAWREKAGYTGRWLIFSAKQGNTAPYSIQSLWLALKGQPGKHGRPRVLGAQDRAGIPNIKGRGGHSLRRMLAGDINSATGNPVLAMRAIGDTDIRMANRYLKDRDDEIRDAFQKLDGGDPKDTPKASPKRDDANEEGVPAGADTPATPK